MTIIICVFCVTINILAAMNPTNPEAWANWLSAGFCIGLATADIILKIMKQQGVTEEKEDVSP